MHDERIDGRVNECCRKKRRPIRLSRRLTTHLYGERQWPPHPPFYRPPFSSSGGGDVDVFLYDEGKCILRTFGCTCASILPPLFLFAFGLNIRGGAHLRTSTGVAQKRGSQVVTILQGNFREKGRSGKLEQEQNSPSLVPTFWRHH